jgi:hypothetical protein
VTLLNGGSATFTATTTLASTATGSLVNTATVTAPGSVTDPNTANNSATDTDTIVSTAPPLPALTLLDNFNRANANTLNNGTHWGQLVLAGSAAIRVNANQALCNGALLCALSGQAIWNTPPTGFSSRQGAAFTFANTPATGTALVLKATGGSVALPTSFIRVRYETTAGGRVVVATTTNGGLSYTTRATLPGAFANGNTLSAIALNNGQVFVYKTVGATTTVVGAATVPAPWSTGVGRIGMQVPNGARVDNFRGAVVP